jgi:hypothetical protein
MRKMYICNFKKTILFYIIIPLPIKVSIVLKFHQQTYIHDNSRADDTAWGGMHAAEEKRQIERARMHN